VQLFQERRLAWLVDVKQKRLCLRKRLQRKQFLNRKKIKTDFIDFFCFSISGAEKNEIHEEIVKR
jgi:hypothetical protein